MMSGTDHRNPTATGIQDNKEPCAEIRNETEDTCQVKGVCLLLVRRKILCCIAIEIIENDGSGDETSYRNDLVHCCIAH